MMLDRRRVVSRKMGVAKAGVAPPFMTVALFVGVLLAGALAAPAVQAAPLPAALNGVWALEPGKCPENGQIAKQMDRGFPSIIRIAKGQVTMKNGACRFTRVVRSAVGNVWAVHLACVRGKETWQADYVYVLRGGRLAVIDVNGLAVSYQRCK